MKIVLFLFMCCAALGGWFILENAKSAIHEILAGVCFLQAALFLCAVSILDAMDRHSKARADEADKAHNAALSLARNIGKRRGED